MPTARKQSSTRKPTTRRKPASAEGGASDSSTLQPPSPEPSSPSLGLVARPFEPTREPQPAITAVDLDVDRFEPEPPEPFAWTAAKAESVVRVIGLVANTIDPLASSDHADDLWKADDDDCAEIAPPLARIMNRHATLRHLAGFSDEAELTAAMWSYARKNTAQRGRIKMLEKRARDAANDEHRSLYESEPTQAAPPPKAVIPAAPPPVTAADFEPETPSHLAPPVVEFAGERAGDFDGIAPAGTSGDDLGMFAPGQSAPKGYMPDLPLDQYE